MARVLFFEKPGCINNTRQKKLLAESGHEVEARNLLTEPWTPERLRPFFGARPVAEWFNRSSPKVKSGAVVPERIAADQALAAMCADPLLIRRPLIQVGDRRECGFDESLVDAWIGLGSRPAMGEDCPRSGGPSCDRVAAGDLARKA